MKEDIAGLGVNLLKDAVKKNITAITAHGGQIEVKEGLVDGDQNGVVVGDFALVEVGAVFKALAAGDFENRFVVFVQHVTLARGIAFANIASPVSQVFFALVILHADVVDEGETERCWISKVLAARGAKQSEPHVSRSDERLTCDPHILKRGRRSRKCKDQDFQEVRVRKTDEGDLFR